MANTLSVENSGKRRRSPARALRYGGGTLALLAFALPGGAQTPYASSIQATTEAIQNPYNRGDAALWQTLKKLHTRASMLMITAHPDDEDGGMLDYETRGEGARVALLTLNRGEGGANVMSPDYWDALGLVRTEELLHAGRYYGVQPVLDACNRLRLFEDAGRSASRSGDTNGCCMTQCGWCAWCVRWW